MVSYAFLFFAAILKAVMDAIAFHSLGHGSPFWDISISWLNKYKDHDVSHGPAFFGSTTFLVSLTDGWHLTQHFFLLCMFGAIVSYQKKFSRMVDCLTMATGFGIVFEIAFRALSH